VWRFEGVVLRMSAAFRRLFVGANAAAEATLA
jgi:hypothetical protein